MEKKQPSEEEDKKAGALPYNHPHSYERTTLIPSGGRTLKGSPSSHKAPTLRRFCRLSALTGQSQASVAEGKFGVKTQHSHRSLTLPFAWSTTKVTHGVSGESMTHYF